MFAKDAVRKGYSATPVSPSSKLMFSWGVTSSASEKSTMFVRLAYIRNRRGVSSPLPDIGGGQREGSTPNLKHHHPRPLYLPSLSTTERRRTFCENGT